MRSRLIAVLCLAMALNGLAAQPVAAQTTAPNWYVYFLAASTQNPPLLYLVMRQRVSNAAFELGIWTSRDAGATWARSPARGLERVQTPRAFALDSVRSGVLYLSGSDSAGGDSQLYRSGNGGADWTPVGPPVASSVELTALAVDPRDSNTLYAGRRASCYGNCGELVLSRDGGVTWQPFDLNRPVQPRYQVTSLVVDPRDGNTLWAVATYTYRNLAWTLLRGDRNGNWVEIPAPAALSGHGPAGLAFDVKTGLLYTGSIRAGGLNPATEDSRLWVSDNPTATDPSAVGWRAVAAWHNGLWNWSFPSELVRPLAIGGPGGPIFVRTVSGDTAVWRSSDGGSTWQAVRLPAPANMPGAGVDGWTAPTGHAVSGEWLRFLKAHGDTDNLGYPRTPIIADPMAGGQTVQYFQRLVLEWHPENPPAYRIQRRLLGDLLYPGAEPPLARMDAPPLPWVYFPFTPGKITGLGHFVANRTRSGESVYFLDYFQSHGGVDAFGYPKEEPVLRNGVWTQRFQAAVFEYHPEFDVDGNVPGTAIPLRNFRVMLELLGDEYIALNALPYQ